MTRRRLLLGVAAAAIAAFAAVGGWAAIRSPGPASLASRAATVESTLRCPTCQGLSVAESTSPVAAGMRQLVRRQLAGGATDAQVRAYFIARYGDWILLSPPRRGVGWLVWFAPPVLLLAGAVLLRRTWRRRRPSPAVTSVEDLAAAVCFANDSPDGALTEDVTAALNDLAAARAEAEFDPAAQASVEQALTQLAAALRGRDATGTGLEASPPTATEVDDRSMIDRPATRARRSLRYVLPGAGVLYAGVLAVTLTHALGARAAGAVPTGTFATRGPSPAATPAPSLSTLATATKAHPRDGNAWLRYASSLDAAGRLASAEPAYRKALALEPASTVARERLAWLLTRGGSPDEALPLLAPLARQHPDDPQVVLLLGLAQRGAGVSQATATLRHYLQLAPTSVQAQIVRALLNGSAP